MKIINSTCYEPEKLNIQQKTSFLSPEMPNTFGIRDAI
jgi:hypothetical protein